MPRIRPLSKKIGMILLTPIWVVIGIVLLVVVVLTMTFFVLCRLYLKILERLRGDPKSTLTSLIEKSVESSRTLENAIKYFEVLTDSIAQEGDATISRTKKSIEKPADGSNVDKILVFERVLSSNFATIKTVLKVLETTDRKGEVLHISAFDGEDPQLASVIFANIAMASHMSDPEFDIEIRFDEIGAYFCIGVLQNGGWCNRKSGQFWSHLAGQEIWIVRYDKKGRTFGFRGSKVLGLAREKWFDKK